MNLKDENTKHQLKVTKPFIFIVMICMVVYGISCYHPPVYGGEQESSTLEIYCVNNSNSNTGYDVVVNNGVNENSHCGHNITFSNVLLQKANDCCIKIKAWY